MVSINRLQKRTYLQETIIPCFVHCSQKFFLVRSHDFKRVPMSKATIICRTQEDTIWNGLGRDMDRHGLYARVGRVTGETVRPARVVPGGRPSGERTMAVKNQDNVVSHQHYRNSIVLEWSRQTRITSTLSTSRSDFPVGWSFLTGWSR
jgi:hypothetical protein